MTEGPCTLIRNKWQRTMFEEVTEGAKHRMSIEKQDSKYLTDPAEKKSSSLKSMICNER